MKKNTMIEPIEETLPIGFDEPTSPFYVPEDLRELWARKQAGAILPFGPQADYGPAAVVLLAQAEAPKVTVDRRGERPADFAGVQAWDNARWVIESELRTQITSTRAAEAQSVAHHLFRLQYLREVLTLESEAARSERQAALRDTCPICGERNIAKNGAIATRPLHPVVTPTPVSLLKSNHPKIRSCASCHAVASAEALRILGGEKVGPRGENRADLVSPIVAAEIARVEMKEMPR